jgi:hypothetical protein
MIVLRLTGGIARNRVQHGAAQAVRGSKTAARTPARRRAPPLTARTPWYGEGNSKTAHTRPAAPPLASGARRPVGPKASAERSEGTMEPVRGETRAARLDAQHDSAPGRFLAGDA